LELYNNNYENYSQLTLVNWLW